MFRKPYNAHIFQAILITNTNKLFFVFIILLLLIKSYNIDEENKKKNWERCRNIEIRIINIVKNQITIDKIFVDS